MIATTKRVVKSVLPTDLWNYLRLMRLKLHLATYRRRVVHHTYGGFDLAIELRDGMSAGYYDRDWEEPARITILKERRLKPGALVFDLGAHHAVRALMLARIVGPTGHVVAAEASPHNSQAAERNRTLNSAEKLTILHAAVAEKDGTAIFNCGLNGQIDDGRGVWGRITVPAITLDSLADRYGMPSVVLVDVEGYECQVLRGGRRVLAARPDWFFEVHSGHGLEALGGSVRELLSQFPAEYYRLLTSYPHEHFEPLDTRPDLLNDYSFLLALAAGEKIGIENEEIGVSSFSSPLVQAEK